MSTATKRPLADLDELERLHRAATPAPWEAVLEHDGRGQPVCYYRALVCFCANGERYVSVVQQDELRPTSYEADAALVAAMRNALPGLIAELRKPPALPSPREFAELAVACGVIEEAALLDPAEYDGGVTLHRLEDFRRRLMEGKG